MARITKVDGNTITLESLKLREGDRLEVVPPDCYVVTPKALYGLFCGGVVVGVLFTLALVL